jgi:hypothetical protein
MRIYNTIKLTINVIVGENKDKREENRKSGNLQTDMESEFLYYLEKAQGKRKNTNNTIKSLKNVKLQKNINSEFTEALQKACGLSYSERVTQYEEEMEDWVSLQEIKRQSKIERLNNNNADNED